VQVVILGWSVRAVEEALAQLKSEALKSGLKANANKAKYVRVMGNLPNLRQDWMLTVMFLKSSECTDIYVL
jgi:hypothetical protein